MASLGKSSFSKGSSNADGHKRQASNDLTPLQVDRGFWSDSRGGEIEVQVTSTSAAATTASKVDTRTAPSRSSRSEIILAERLKELSQLESPLLRDLAQGLGRILKIETPRCQKTFKHPYADLQVGERWEEYQGCYGWKGLQEPNFHPVLKAEIIRYGEFAQATYDAFDGNKSSRHCGTCKYLKTDLLEKVGLENRGYEITNFLYATTNLRLFPHFLANPQVDCKHNNKDNRDNNGSSDQSNEELCKHSDEKSKNDENISEGNGGICKSCSENSRQCNWIGFVAVCTSDEEIARLGRRDIVIAWRGTVTTFDWIADMMDYLSPAAFGPDIASSRVRVEKGFFHLYTSTNPKSRYCSTKSARDQVRDAIRALVTKYKPKGKLSITLTGHSLGSALATLCAYDIAECEVDLLSSNVSSEWHFPESRPHKVGPPDDFLSRYHHASIFPKVASLVRGSREDNQDGKHHGGITKTVGAILTRQNHFVNKFRKGRIPVTVYSFGGPRVGNVAFVDRMEELGVAVLRVVNVHDKVTKVPGLASHHLKLKIWNPITFQPSYKHVGVKLKVDNELSSFLKKPAGLRNAHSLEAYLHLVDSYQGEYQGRKLAYKKTFRDHALVNKHQDFLEPEHSIPPRWWQEKNKGLVIKGNGEWGLPDRDESIPRTPLPEEEDEELQRTIDIACDRSSPHP